ncbi:MAG: response regulator [Planctomycetota bacterium]
MVIMDKLFESKSDELVIVPGKTVLIVEDDIDCADSIKIKLENRGYRIVTAFDGLIALDMARDLQPDLVILDIRVPGLSGYHVCRLLKFDERYRKIPIIMLTGKVDRESREMGIKAGADKYITKPFEFTELLAEVSRLLEGQSASTGEIA